MDIAAWLAGAAADAEARGLPELKPLLETLARSTQALRDADGEFRHPAAEHGQQYTAAAHAAHANDDQSSR
jgi:hypothetical protein